MMFDEQIVLHQDQSENAFPHEKRALKDNYEILQNRLKMLHDKQEELAKNLRAVNEYNRELDLEMNSLKPEIIELYKQREQHQTWLLSHGARVEEINRSVGLGSCLLGGIPHFSILQTLLFQCFISLLRVL